MEILIIIIIWYLCGIPLLVFANWLHGNDLLYGDMPIVIFFGSLFGLFWIFPIFYDIIIMAIKDLKIFNKPKDIFLKGRNK